MYGSNKNDLFFLAYCPNNEPPKCIIGSSFFLFSTCLLNRQNELLIMRCFICGDYVNGAISLKYFVSLLRIKGNSFSGEQQTSCLLYACKYHLHYDHCINCLVDLLQNSAYKDQVRVSL